MQNFKFVADELKTAGLGSNATLLWTAKSLGYPYPSSL